VPAPCMAPAESFGAAAPAPAVPSRGSAVAASDAQLTAARRPHSAQAARRTERDLKRARPGSAFVDFVDCTTTSSQHTRCSASSQRSGVMASWKNVAELAGLGAREPSGSARALPRVWRSGPA
jgi:hypothetical protein